MNKNKGIIGIGLILAIVLGVAVVGGGAYYLGKSKEEKTPENILPASNEEQNLPVDEKEEKVCNASSPSSIKVLSPNGGEVFNAGDKITVKWKSCNVDPGSIGIVLIKHDKLSSHTREQEMNDYAGFTLGGFDGFQGTADDGIQEITLPDNSNPNLVSGQYYTIVVMGTGDATNIGSGYSPRDYSDEWFTINSKKTILTILPQYVGSHSACGGSSQCWPPVITTSLESYSCNNIGVVPHTEGNEINEQRFINGRVYCIYSISSGYAGGRGYTYTYMIPNGKGTKLAKFGFVYPSCGVWQGDGTSKFSDCKNNQSNFNANLDNLIDSLMQSN